MIKYGKEFINHFEIVGETSKQYRIKCLVSEKTFCVNKKSFDSKSVLCKCCKRRIPIWDKEDYYKFMYQKRIDEYLNCTNSANKANIQKSIRYFSELAGIPSSDFTVQKYTARIEELNQKIYKNDLLRQTSEYNTEDYYLFKKRNNSNRSLFGEIKRVVPDFTPYNRFADYRDALLEERKKVKQDE